LGVWEWFGGAGEESCPKICVGDIDIWGA
jgi:hypothetical protein